MLVKTALIVAFSLITNPLWAAEPTPTNIKYDVTCPNGGRLEATIRGSKLYVPCGRPRPVRLNDATDKPTNSFWKDEFRLQANLLGGSWIGQGFLTSVQLAFSWFPGGGTHGVRVFGGAGYSFAPFNFVYGLGYTYQPQNKTWSLTLGLSSHNLKGGDYRLDWTGLAGLVDARLRLGDGPFSIMAQTHFGVAWDANGKDAALISILGGIGIDFW